MRLGRVAVLAGLVTSLTAARVLADAPASSSEPLAVEPAPAPPALDGASRTWLAQPPSPKVVAAPEPAHSPWRSALLILVVVGIGGAALYARRSKRVAGKFPQSARLRVMSSVRVGPKGFLVLAGVGERTLLLGVTDDSVRRIAWMANEPLEQDAATPAAPPPFKEFMRGLRASTDDASTTDAGSPAQRLAAESHDEVRWSPEAKTTRTPALATARTQPDLGASPNSFEQQAAGIMKRKARRRG